MTAPTKKSDLVQIAHPGFKVIYHKPHPGKAVVEPHTLAEIDAHDAVARFPKAYSFDVPDDHEVVPAGGGYDPFSPAPTATAASAAVGDAAPSADEPGVAEPRPKVDPAKKP